MVFEESRVLIRDSKLCFTTPLNEKLDLLGLCFIIAIILGCCLTFSMIFSKGSWICSTLTNRSSLHCKRSDGTLFAKNLLNVSAARLLSDTILVLPSISVILFLQFCRNVYYRQSFLYLDYWKRISFLCKKEIHGNSLFIVSFSVCISFSF